MADFDSAPQVIDLEVQGMTCASCAARIEKKLNKVDGVQASVNYATERAHIVAGEDTSAEDLIKIVQNTGYDARIPDPQTPVVDRAAQLKSRLVVAITLGVPLILIGMIPALQFPGWQWASLALATPVLWWAGLGFHKSALVNLRHGATTMDTLISLGTTAAYLWSLCALLFGDAGQIGLKHQWMWHLSREHGMSNIYFEASAAIIMFILIGRYIEARSRRDAGEAMRALLEVAPKTVLVKRGETELVIPIEALKVGDEFIVRPGEKIASDAIVVSGQSAVDNSVITGESVPIEVSPGSKVVGAALNTNGRLIVRATAVGEDTQLAQIAHLVEVAQTGRSATQDLANKISGIFVPMVIAIALATLAIWLIQGADLSFAITAAVSVLIISCPCALGLATPTALLAGSLRGSKMGILIRGPRALEQAHKISTVVMDKTGTITTGVMALTGQKALNDTQQLLMVAASLEKGSSHPIGKAIIAAAGQVASAEQIENIPGRGIRGYLDGQVALAGNRAMLDEASINVDAEIQDAAKQYLAQGASLVYVAFNDEILGVLAVSDQIAAGSPKAIQRFRALGLKTVMLTGDNEQAAKLVADEIGIDEFRAQVMPSDKYEIIRELQNAGEKLAMIGDGVNDAAALTQADLGISMGNGTDVAIASSDLTLMRHDLGLAADAIRLSRRTLGTIKVNLFWAFAYNVVAIPVAALGYLNPMISGAAMAFSSVFVVLNSLRLRGFKADRS